MDICSITTQSAPILIPLIVGYLLDLLFGDPYNMPHPVKLFGRLISLADNRLNKGANRFFKGLVTSMVLITTTWISLFIIVKSLTDLPWVYYPLASILVYWGLANKCLIDETRLVEKALSENGLDAGRKQLSYIVGRDTSKLNANQIRTAVLETLSENLSDGVIAPLFYYALGGIPLMLAYKMINTLDSMIGYKNDKYLHFGKFAAKLDDVANFIPARITAILMVLITWNKRGVQFIFNFGNKHASPNSGYPEAALAGILNCRFGGPNQYHGIIVDKPYIGYNNRQLTYNDLQKALKINHLVTLASVLMIVIIFISFY